MQTVAATPSEGPSHRKPPAREHQEVEAERESREHAECPNGSVVSERGEASASSGDSDSGKRTLGLEGEGVSVGKREDLVVVSAVSCREQQQEEVDSELSVIREVLHAHTVSKTKAHNKIHSGNTQEGTMGQTQGLLPESEEKKKARGDLPEEREAEGNSGQEAFLPSGNTQQLDGQTNDKQRSHFYINVDFNASKKGKEIQETGNGNRISTDCMNEGINKDSDILSFRPNMAPGPVHNVRLEPSPVVENTLDAATGDQITAPPEPTSDCSEEVISDSRQKPPPCDEVTEAPGKPDRLVPEVAFTTEEIGGEIQVDQTLLPETEQSSSESDVRPILSPEISDDTSQISVHYRGEEPSQSDIRDAHITVITDQTQDPERSQSPSLVLDQISVPPGSTVTDSNPEEAGNGTESKIEREPLAFQTPPESPCEFFSVDGFQNSYMLFNTNDSIDTTHSTSLEPGPLADSKKSPVTMLCGSFSKMTLRGSAPDPQIDSTTSESIQRSAPEGELKTCKPPAEVEETNEEKFQLEPKLVEKCEGSESSQIVNNMPREPSCDFVSKENLNETAAEGSETPNDQAPKAMDVKGAWMKITTQLGENLEVSSHKTLLLSTSVSKDIIDGHSEVLNVKDGGDKFFEGLKIFKEPQPELMASSESIADTFLGLHLEVTNTEEKVIEQLKVMTFEESISGTTLDLQQEIITPSEETIVETSLGSLPEVKIIEDQQPKVMISDESSGGTSLGHDYEVTPSVETTGEAPSDPHYEVHIPDESVQILNLEKSVNDPHDLQHKVTPFEESIRGTLYLHHDLITPSEKTVRETFSGPLSEDNSSKENVLPQVIEVMTSEETVSGTSPGPNHNLNISCEEVVTITSLEVKSSEKNGVDQQSEATICEKSKNTTSQDPELEKSIQGSHPEVTIGETALDQEPEVTAFEESISETPNHTQLEETSCGGNLTTSLEPPPEVTSSEMDARLPDAPAQCEIGVLESSVSSHDLDLALENVFTPGSLRISDQQMDLDGGTGLYMDSSSGVEVDSGLIQDLPSSDNVSVCTSGSLKEEKSHTEEEYCEEPKEEPVAGEKLFNVGLV